MINETLRPFHNELMREHRHMHQLMQALRQKMVEGKQCRWTQEAVLAAGTALCHLREYAHEHFAREEDEGCFEDAIAMMPTCAARVDVLRQEHREILSTLDRFQVAANLDDNRPEYWNLFAGQIDELLAYLNDHECREARLIAEVFNVAPDDT